MDLFSCMDSRQVIQFYLDVQAGKGRGVKTNLASQFKVHSSHLSQILSGQRQLTPDQALTLAQLMGYSEIETDYLIHLIYFERSGTLEYRQHCQDKLEELRQKSQKISERFAHQTQLSDEHKTQFYSHYLYSAIRLFCSTKKIGRTFDEILVRFQLHHEQLTPILRFLRETALVVDDKGHFKLGTSSTLISRESPHVHRHHANWRNLAIHQSPLMKEEELMFTAPMSISKKDFGKIKESLLKQISSLSETIKNSPAEDVACLNIDFIWVKK